MSNKTKRETVAEMNPAYKEDNAEEGRSLWSRRANYRIHEKQQ